MLKIVKGARDLVVSTFIYSFACIILGAPMVEYVRTIFTE